MSAFSKLTASLGEIENNEAYPNIPANLIKNIKHCISKGQANRLIKQLVDNPTLVVKRIDDMFSIAAGVTGLTPSELLQRTDFESRDCGVKRIDSAFAEIRSVNFLGNQGFINIRPIRSKGKRRADISATLRKRLYSFEVRNLSYDSKSKLSIKQWIGNEYEKKKSQLEETQEEINSNINVFIVVIDPIEIIAGNTHEDFVLIARETWELIERPRNTHICIVTGRVSTGLTPDDAVFPPWQAEGMDIE